MRFVVSTEVERSYSAMVKDPSITVGMTEKQ